MRVLGAVSLMIGSFVVGLASSGARPTSVHFYVAFKSGRLAPGLGVRASVRGSCWTTSIVDGRPYTWRCFHGNYIHDPCLSPTPHARIVVCPDAPWSKSVLVLRLTKPLPRWKVYKSGSWSDWPWGVQTTTGKRCESLSGVATGGVAGMQPTYTCEGDGLLLGLPRRHTPTWTIYHAASWHSKRATLVSISDAWW